MDIFCKISMRTSSPPHYPKISHDFPQVIFWFKALGAPFSPSVPERRSGEEEEEPESVINAFVDPPFRAIILLAVRCHRNRFFLVINSVVSSLSFVIGRRMRGICRYNSTALLFSPTTNTVEDWQFTCRSRPLLKLTKSDDPNPMAQKNGSKNA